MMTRCFYPHHPENQNKCDLASKLVNRMGVEGAISACVENHWRGIQEDIEKRYVVKRKA